MNTVRLRSMLALWLLVSLAGCGGSDHSPTVDIYGSYFPAWMICVLLGVALALIVRLIFTALGMNPYIRPAPLIYPMVIAIFSIALWLAFFRN
jgi:hypothetical protein